MALRDVTLDDKYDLGQRHVFVTGFQALVRLCLMQKELDRRNGLNTAGFVTGYRGSPLGNLDSQFLRAKRFLEKSDLRFQSGINEDLAATAVWGSQQAELRGEGKYDGVFAMWYGKGPGVDRTGDVFRHANLAGSAKYGGVLALMGDDHTAESSTTAHQSEYHFIDVMIPVLNPAGVQEVLDYGLYGWAMSRYTGAWTALKTMHETIESTAAIDASLERINVVTPDDFRGPEGGLNIRLHDQILAQEARLHDYKRDAMLAFVRANKLNRTVTSGGRSPKIGIITTGKSYLDVRQAFDELGIDELKCNELGIRLYKVACVWPLSQRELKEFAEGLDLIIVVEEKRSLIEVQVREELYGTANQPVCIGKKDEAGNWLFPVKGALDPNEVAICLGERLLKYHRNDDISARVARLKEFQRIAAATTDVAQRIPYFCSGCPHNSSTVVPEGMRAYAGIGCHYMAQWMDRSTLGYTQMGGEGANWIGEAPFSNRQHVFQNLGDGTYNHSGYLAIRAAIASNTNITYKILFNDAVAMTGGQPNDGGLTVPQVARQVAAEGAARVVVVTDEPGKYSRDTQWPAGLTIHHRDDLNAVQRELAAIPGVTVLIYDQTCAAEKRRRRKRGTFPDPAKRVFINDAVCEGCGDCSVQSNCIAVQPLETEFGRKRRIDQGSCNKDFSCLSGFCPSFVTVHGAAPRKLQDPAKIEGDDLRSLPLPPAHMLDRPYGILIAGVGGSGVITLGALLGMAAHMEGKACTVLDVTGLAQKNGAVTSHVRLAQRPEDLHAVRIAAGGANLLLGCDMVVAVAPPSLQRIETGATRAIVNTHVAPTAQFILDQEIDFELASMQRALRAAVGSNAIEFIDASALTTALLGDELASNLFMLGYGFQKGLVPLSLAAIERAIVLNGVAPEMNLRAFAWGRLAAHDPARVEALARPLVFEPAPAAHDVTALFERRAAILTDYQDAAYARRYRELVQQIAVEEKARVPGRSDLAEAVARNLFKLMAYKDEYEVARLYTNGEFLEKLHRQFEGDLRLEFHLVAPLVASRDTVTGLPRKRTYGAWMLKLFKLIARLRRLRGTPFDVFGYSAERRRERELIREYEGVLRELAAALDRENHALAVEIASLPEQIKGFGHIKACNIERAKAREGELLALFRGAGHTAAAA